MTRSVSSDDGNTVPRVGPLPAAPARVAVVEDDLQMRERISRVIRVAPELELVLATATATEAIAGLRTYSVDVLLVDLGLPDRPGLDVIRECRSLQPACAVMVMTIFGDESNMVKAFEAGASGYLLKDGTESDLASHIRHLREGGSPLSPVIARQLLRRWQARDDTHSTGMTSALPGTPGTPGKPKVIEVEKLSPREFQVLDLVSRGFTYQEIAGRIGVAVTTIQTHIRNIYGKLDVHNKSEAVYEARQLGLLP